MNSIQRPAVSIVLPTYNGQRYIQDSIKSCLMQTWTDFELIIVNDCSTDSTAEIIEELAQRDSRIKVIHNSENKKLPASLNIGFSQAQGKYHTWTSDDNMYHSKALEEMFNFLSAHQNIDGVYCDYVKVDENTGNVREWIVKDFDYIGRGNPVGACFLYRNEVYKKLGGYNEELFCVEDYDFWLRAYRSGFVFVPLRKKLYVYRCHSKSLTETKRERIQQMTEKLNQQHYMLISGNNKVPVCQFTAGQDRVSTSHLSEEKKMAIWGWWQGQNLGDNWIRQTLEHFFPAAVFIDTSQRNFSRYDFVMCGGGGLFVRDVIDPWKQQPSIPYGILGVGAEFPHASRSARDLAGKADFFYLRDEYSIACMGISPSSRSYDLTFALPLTVNGNPDLDTALFVWRDPDNLLKYPDFNQYIGQIEGYSDWKLKLSKEFIRIREHDFHSDSCDIESLTSQCGFIVSGRYHGIVAAIQKGIPCIGIDLCPKIRALMQDVGIEEYCLKIGEIGSLGYLIKRAKKDISAIRNKQISYRVKAHQTVQTHIQKASERINNRLYRGIVQVEKSQDKANHTDGCLSVPLIAGRIL